MITIGESIRIHSILIERFGYVVMRLILLEYDLDIIASEDVKYEFVIAIAKGDFKFKEICNWIENNKKKRI